MILFFIVIVECHINQICSINFITGITTATSDTDVAYKEYADGKPGYALTATPVIGEYYKGDVDVVTSTVGLNTTFVYDTAGSYTYPIDSSASSLSLYITGSGGGGSESTSDSTYSPTGFEWGSVCSSLSIWSYGCKVFASNDSIVIAASQTGKGIETSNNALDWTARTIGVSYANSSLIYANNLFVYFTRILKIICQLYTIYMTFRLATMYYNQWY